jgi:hypothetical protein
VGRGVGTHHPDGGCHDAHEEHRKCGAEAEPVESHQLLEVLARLEAPDNGSIETMTRSVALSLLVCHPSSGPPEDPARGQGQIGDRRTQDPCWFTDGHERHAFRPAAPAQSPTVGKRRSTVARSPPRRSNDDVARPSNVLAERPRGRGDGCGVGPFVLYGLSI